jgi:drug/metabolite transporter (DMT)-like permease
VLDEIHMEIGLIFALLAAVAFAASQALFKKGASQTGESFSGVLIAVFTGIILFTFLLFFTGDWGKIWSLSWQGFALLAAAGIVHFVIARLLTYKSIQLIGANKASAITKTNILWTLIAGVTFLNEPLTILLVLGALGIAVGATLVSIEKKIAGGEEPSGISKINTIGVLSGLGGAACWAISAALVKPVLGEIGSPLAATFISYVAACPVLAGFLLNKEQRQQVTQLSRPSLIVLTLSGVAVAFGQIFRYTAFNYIPISVAQPFMGISIVFLLLFSFLINRNIEVFTWKVIMGMVMAMIGVFLISQ